MKCKNCGADIRPATQSELEDIEAAKPDVIHIDGYWACEGGVAVDVAEADES